MEDTTMETITTETTERNAEIAVKHTIPMTTGDLDLLDEILEENWVNHPIQFNEGDGVQGFKNKSQMLFENFDFAFDHQEVLPFGDYVLIRSVVSGRVKSELMGPDVKGKTFAFNTLEYHKFRDGKIVESWHLQDYYALLAQLGVIPNLMQAQLDPYHGWDNG
jgi:predicted ester cyclase